MMKPFKKRQVIGEESIEAKPHGGYTQATTINDEVKELWKGVFDSAKTDLGGGFASSLSEQIIGFGGEATLEEGQEISLRAQQEAKKQGQKEESKITAEFMDYKRTVINAENNSEATAERQVKEAVEEIRSEIKKLMQTSKLVERTVKDATAEKAPVKPGKYHLNFFDFVLNILKDATRKLEDSVSFGAVFTSKKQQSHYWNMTNSKKGGTSFMLSGERTSATQTG